MRSSLLQCVWGDIKLKILCTEGAKHNNGQLSKISQFNFSIHQHGVERKNNFKIIRIIGTIFLDSSSNLNLSHTFVLESLLFYSNFFQGQRLIISTFWFLFTRIMTLSECLIFWQAGFSYTPISTSIHSFLSQTPCRLFFVVGGILQHFYLNKKIFK